MRHKSEDMRINLTHQDITYSYPSALQLQGSFAFPLQENLSFVASSRHPSFNSVRREDAREADHEVVHEMRHGLGSLWVCSVTFQLDGQRNHAQGAGLHLEFPARD